MSDRKENEAKSNKRLIGRRTIKSSLFLTHWGIDTYFFLWSPNESCQQISQALSSPLSLSLSLSLALCLWWPNFDVGWANQYGRHHTAAPLDTI